MLYGKSVFLLIEQCPKLENTLHYYLKYSPLILEFNRLNQFQSQARNILKWKIFNTSMLDQLT